VATPIAGLAFSVQSTPAFTLREPPATLEPAVFGALESLEKGGVSEMVTTGAKGMIVHVADKAMPATDETNPRFVETRGQIAAFIGSRNAGDYLNELVEKELAKTEPATP
jgi:peptidyl-prolyl cis-trans isomerase D